MPANNVGYWQSIKTVAVVLFAVILIKCSIDATKCTKLALQKDTSLVDAASAGCTRLVGVILNRGYVPDETWSTALEAGCASSNIVMVNMLITYANDTRIKKFRSHEHEDTVLHVLSRLGCTTGCTAILRRNPMLTEVANIHGDLPAAVAADLDTFFTIVSHYPKDDR